MKALILGLGIPAMITLAVVLAAGMCVLVKAAGSAIVRFARHEMLMRPKERYYLA